MSSIKAASYVEQHIEALNTQATLDRDAVSRLSAELSALQLENSRLRDRQSELLALVAKISQTVPLESEVAEALEQRGKLLAEVGTLKARVAELEKLMDEYP